MEEHRRARMPLLVRAIAWFEIIGGLLAVISGAVLFARGGWAFILPGAVGIAGGWGLLHAQLWAYYLVLLFAGINVVLASPLLTRGRTVAMFTLVLNAAILLVLLNRASRQWAESLRTR